MNRPGPVGIALVLAFAVVAVIEFRTVLGMVGIDIAIGPYFAGAAILLVGGAAALFAVPEELTPESV
ncbi:hypothetical protein [Halobacteriaceae bacterium SHR40]|uniref:hypothetical protein n=1 Tax=Halovenus amylolytica TaxID=2500550 RepID=UPI000FE34021